MTAWLDRVLGRVTMYALVILCLTLIAVVAFGLSLFNQLNVTPFQLLVSAAVLFTFSYLANGLFGVVFRTHPQLSSTAITALILLFVFQPTLELPGLGGLALAATLAVASKYLLAVRRRHIFNPAAFGAAVVGAIVIGGVPLGFASWWVGTPVLLPFVILGALAVLFRTRRLGLGSVYVLTAIVCTTLFAVVLAGTPVAPALQAAALSSPIFFFAGFMLSEPLTLPPRRWQQMSLAVLVAILASIPWSIPGTSISNSPQLALLVGNLIAFFFGQRRAIRLDLVGRRRLTPTIWEYSFQPVQPIRYEPGQFVELALPHHHTDARGWRRMFSIASAPEDGGIVRFGIRFPERSSSFKRTLFALEPGSRVMATAVYGDFILPEDTSRKLLLVAAGIGITPYVGRFEQMAKGAARDVVVIYELAALDDLAYGHELVAAGAKVVIVAPELPENLPLGWTYAGTGPLTADMIHEYVPDARERETYLSGLPALVPQLRRSLKRSGVKRVRTDSFIGY